VVKLYRRDGVTPLFPNDAKAEAAVLRHLAGTRLAPELVATTETVAGPCMVYNHVDGLHGVVAHGDMAGLLARLHRVPPPPGLRELPFGAETILRQGDRILAACSDAARFERLRPASVSVDPGQSVFLHGDPVPANVIAAPWGACLIDWQCPAIGDPTEDLAVYMSPAMQFLYGAGPLSSEQAQAFLSAYGDEAVADRWRILAPAFHWRMAAHCLWRLEREGPQSGNAQALELEIAALNSAAQSRT
jgi:aminoglycoside phosphotransferase (APT) family kinase protein